VSPIADGGPERSQPGVIALLPPLEHRDTCAHNVFYTPGSASSNLRLRETHDIIR
jgi:hypothetical protein